MADRVIPRVLAVGRSTTSADRFVQLEHRLGGKRKEQLIAVSAIPSARLETLGLLTNASRQALGTEVERAIQTMPVSFYVVTEPGWHGGSFVLPDGEAIPRLHGMRCCLSAELEPFTRKYHRRGSMEASRRLASLATGNDWLMMTMSVSFTGPVALLLGVEAPIIQLVGAPNAGKTTGAICAASMVGESVPETANNTPANLQRLARANHGGLLILDDTKHVSPNSAAQFDDYLRGFFAVAEGSYKGRLTDAAPAPSYCVPIITTSNESLDQMRNRVGGHVDDAHRGRIIDVPVDFHGLGSIVDLHGLENRDRFLALLRSLALENYGNSFYQFLVQIGRVGDLRVVRQYLRRDREAYLDVARRQPWATTRDLARVHNRMATIFAAGALAIKLRILPWTRELLGKALIRCERDHVALVEMHAVREDANGSAVADPIARLAERFADGDFVDVRVEGAVFDPRRICIGLSGGRREYWITEEFLKGLCGGQAVSDQLKRQLAAKGLLDAPSHRHSTRRNTGGSRRQLLAIRADEFDAFLIAWGEDRDGGVRSRDLTRSAKAA